MQMAADVEQSCDIAKKEKCGDCFEMNVIIALQEMLEVVWFFKKYIDKGFSFRKSDAEISTMDVGQYISEYQAGIVLRIVKHAAWDIRNMLRCKDHKTIGIDLLIKDYENLLLQIKEIQNKLQWLEL